MRKCTLASIQTIFTSAIRFNSEYWDFSGLKNHKEIERKRRRTVKVETHFNLNYCNCSQSIKEKKILIMIIVNKYSLERKYGNKGLECIVVLECIEGMDKGHLEHLYVYVILTTLKASNM